MYLSDLLIYPIKSGMALPKVSATVLADGLDGDRRAVIVRPDNVCVTARDRAALLSIRCMLGTHHLHLHAPGMAPLTVAIDAELTSTRTVSIWRSEAIGLCGSARADQWLQRYLDMECQLVVMSAQTRRAVAGMPCESVTFADAAPLLLTNEASLAELNGRLEQPVEIGRFRPNLVISGAQPFEEDTWERIRIGEVEFELVGPCDRCVMIALNPAAPDTPRDHGPLQALARYRRNERGKVFFGEMVVPRSLGTLALDQPVEVLKRKAAPVFMPPAGSKLQRLEDRELSAHLMSASEVQQNVLLRCTGVTDDATDLRSFHFEQLSGAPLRYHAGQYLVFSGTMDGTHWQRCYSLTSSPQRNVLSISVKRIAGGRVSNWLHTHFKPGMELHASGPAGHFVFAAKPARKILLLSAGSGITPVMSLLRWLADTGLTADIVFHHGAQTHQHVPFKSELAELATQMPSLSLSFNLSRDSEATLSNLSVYSGRLDSSMLASICPDIDERAVFVCGPGEFMRTVREALNARPDFDMHNLIEERFATRTDKSAATVTATRPQPFNIIFARAEKTVSGEHRTSVLNLARQAGIALESSCELGNCGSCRCRVTAGSWGLTEDCADIARSILSQQEKADGIILACTTYPKGELIVDL